MDHIVVLKVPYRIGIFKRKQGFSFDMQCWKFLCNYTQLAFDEFSIIAEKKGGDVFLNKAIYAAAISYNKWHSIKSLFTEDNVKRWLGKLTVYNYTKLIEAMGNSRIGGKTIAELLPDVIEKDEKKN